MPVEFLIIVKCQVILLDFSEIFFSEIEPIEANIY